LQEKEGKNTREVIDLEKTGKKKEGIGMNKRKALLVSVIVLVLGLGLLVAWLLPKPLHIMSVSFGAGDQSAKSDVQLPQGMMALWVTATIQEASPNTMFTWALYERLYGTYQWIFFEGTGSVNTVSPESTDGNGYCTWQIGIFSAENHTDMPSAPSPIYGWPMGQYDLKITVTCPAPVTNNTLDSNILSLLIG
jgi:hypothetical protein